MPTLALCILTGISFVLTVWRWMAGLGFPLHRREPIVGGLPPLTVLKPLKGCDGETKECLRSWLRQEYPGPLQILFGVASPDDPVCRIVNELLAEFPNIDARLLLCRLSLGANGKVSTLQQLEPEIRHEIVMISDADVIIAPDFAAQTVGCLRRSGAGLVNCFYRLGNPSTLAMQWEAAAVNSDFWSQVLQSRSIRPVDFALGAVMTLPLEQLKAAGGFAALADYLADDNQLGRRVAALGKEIEFATVVAECRDAPMNWAEVWMHQCRWARTIRVCQPGPFFFSLLNNSTIWPLLLLASAGSAGLGAFIGCAGFRIFTALQQEYRMMQRSPNWAYFWMPLLKDVLDAAIWAGAFLSNGIVWRGERYRIAREGKLVKV